MPRRCAPATPTWYASSGKIIVAFAGPPPVRTYTKLMLFAVQIVDSISVMMTIGIRLGRVMFQYRWNTSAPSIPAASYSSDGIAWRPARNIIDQNGVLAHTTATTTDQSATL